MVDGIPCADTRSSLARRASPSSETFFRNQIKDGTYEGRQTTPKERGWATTAAVASAVQQGAAVVRVHDVLEMGDVVRVADAIWG
jgi:dihydropteroate synthase